MKEFDLPTKKTIIDQIVRGRLIPILEAITDPIPEECIDLLIAGSKIREVTKDEFVEFGGSFEDGNLYYLHSGIARSCYYGPDVNIPIVSRIWKKHEVIFDVISFMNGESRTEAVQMLENGLLLYISYYNLKGIILKYPKMTSLLMFFQIEKENYNKFYQHILKLTVEERVRIYLDTNPLIRDRVTRDCIALHLGISRSKFSSAYALYSKNKISSQVNLQ